MEIEQIRDLIIFGLIVLAFSGGMGFLGRHAWGFGWPGTIALSIGTAAAIVIIIFVALVLVFSQTDID